MAVGVIHLFELVEVEKQQGKAALIPMRRGNLLVQFGLKVVTVGQLGQLVIIRRMPDFFFGLLFLRDVRKNGNASVHTPILPIGRTDAHAFHIGLTIFAAIDNFAIPFTGLGNGFPHGGVKGLVMTARAQKLRILPQHLFGAVAGESGKGRVHQHHLVVFIANHHRFIRVEKHQLRQLKLIVCFDALLNVTRHGTGAGNAAKPVIHWRHTERDVYA